VELVDDRMLVAVMRHRFARVLRGWRVLAGATPSKVRPMARLMTHPVRRPRGFPWSFTHASERGPPITRGGKPRRGAEVARNRLYAKALCGVFVGDPWIVRAPYGPDGLSSSVSSRYRECSVATGAGGEPRLRPARQTCSVLVSESGLRGRHERAPDNPHYVQFAIWWSPSFGAGVTLKPTCSVQVRPVAHEGLSHTEPRCGRPLSSECPCPFSPVSLLAFLAQFYRVSV